MLARFAAFAGINYRDFLVGCAMLAYNGSEYRIFWGANFMPALKPGPKRCAEFEALEKAIKAGYLEIIAIAVAGLPQRDGRSGKDCKTLPPCGECRTMLSGWNGVKPETIIFTVHRFEEVCEECSFRELQQKYN